MFYSARKELLDMIGVHEVRNVPEFVAPLEDTAIKMARETVNIFKGKVVFPETFEVASKVKVSKYFKPLGKTATLSVSGRNFQPTAIDNAIARLEKDTAYVQTIDLVLEGVSLKNEHNFKLEGVENGIVYRKNFPVFEGDITHVTETVEGKRHYTNPHTGARFPVHPYGAVCSGEFPLGSALFLGLKYAADHTEVATLKYEQQTDHEAFSYRVKGEVPSIPFDIQRGKIRVALQTESFACGYISKEFWVKDGVVYVQFQRSGKIKVM